MQITVIIHTFNEEKNIEECIKSAQYLTSDILVVDMHSSDKTVEIAKKEGATISTFSYHAYVEPARSFGIKTAQTRWVFLLDADERITKALAQEVHEKIKAEPYSFYRVPRKNIFADNIWLKHGGWWPDYQIRLIDKRFFKSWPSAIHSTPHITGAPGYLKNYLEHYSHRDLESMVNKTIEFEDVESDLLYKAGRPVSTTTFFRKFCAELFRRLIRQVGFLDGGIGIIESIYQAFSKTVTYLYLYEKKNSSSVRSLP